MDLSANLRVGRLLHRSKRGEVLLATWCGEPAVVKRGRGEKGPDRVRREAGTLAQLDHPNIVRALADGTHRGEQVLVLERLDGPSLRGHLRSRRRLTDGHAASIGCQLAGALAHVHGRDLVHADLKPANTMLHRGRVVLVDFDLARAPGDLRGRVGTRLFAPPEQARREYTCPASDVWGLGVVLHRAVTSHLPFTAASGQPQLTERAPRVADHAPEAIDPALAALIDAMLEPDASARPTLQEVVAVLEPIAELAPAAA